MTPEFLRDSSANFQAPAGLGQQNCTLYLGDLSSFCQEMDLINAFKVYGEITDIRLMRSVYDGTCLGYGFLTFAEMDQAQRAIDGMNGQFLIGRKLNISWASRRNKHQGPNQSTENKRSPTQSNNHNDSNGQLNAAEVHFSFVSKQSNFLVTEAIVRSIFEEFGPIQNIYIKRSSYNERGCQHGYGFVHYPLGPQGISAAIQATSVICQTMIDSVLYDCTLTRTFEQYLTHGGGGGGIGVKEMNLPAPAAAAPLQQQMMMRAIPSFYSHKSDLSMGSSDSMHIQSSSATGSNYLPIPPALSLSTTSSRSSFNLFGSSPMNHHHLSSPPYTPSSSQLPPHHSQYGNSSSSGGSSNGSSHYSIASPHHHGLSMLPHLQHQQLQQPQQQQQQPLQYGQHLPATSSSFLLSQSASFTQPQLSHSPQSSQLSQLSQQSSSPQASQLLQPQQPTQQQQAFIRQSPTQNQTQTQSQSLGVPLAPPGSTSFHPFSY